MDGDPLLPAFSISSGLTASPPSPPIQDEGVFGSQPAATGRVHGGVASTDHGDVFP